MLKIFLFIFIVSVIALLVDIYIYKRVISRHNFGRLWKVGYLVYAIFVDTMVVSALVVAKTSPGNEGPASRTIIWIIGLFFLNAVPKFIYALISTGDYVVQKKIKKTSHIFGYTGTFLALIAFTVIAYGLTFGRSEIRVTYHELEFANLPESFDGLKIVQFTDNHLGNLVSREKFIARMVDTINSQYPDIIVNTGDLINNHSNELDEPIMRLFSSMQCTYGVYSVLGNHDMGIYIKDTVKNPPRLSIDELVAKQESLGWTVLRNRSVYLDNGKDSILITGLDYPMDFSLNSHSSIMTGADLTMAYDTIGTDHFNLVLIHAPQLWNELLDQGRGDLALAGHVHAMQIKFHLGKFEWSPAKFMYDRWSGLYEDKNRYLYINDGAGYVMFPLRIGTKPEVSVFVLKNKR